MLRTGWQATGNGGAPIRFAAYLDTEGMGLRPLVELAARAAAVVTEDMPVEPHLSWTATVSSALPPTAIMISCDTHCVRHASLYNPTKPP